MVAPLGAVLCYDLTAADFQGLFGPLLACMRARVCVETFMFPAEVTVRRRSASVRHRVMWPCVSRSNTEAASAVLVCSWPENSDLESFTLPICLGVEGLAWLDGESVCMKSS